MENIKYGTCLEGFGSPFIIRLLLSCNELGILYNVYINMITFSAAEYHFFVGG